MDEDDFVVVSAIGFPNRDTKNNLLPGLLVEPFILFKSAVVLARRTWTYMITCNSTMRNSTTSPIVRLPRGESV
jgi:hypothetical protein